MARRRLPHPWLLWGVLAGLALGTSLIAIAAARLAKPEPAPAVVFNTINGERIRTADLKGKVVLVNFWATSCVSCLAEMPMLIAAQDRYAGRGYLTMAVAMGYDRPDYVVHFARTRQLPFKVAIDLSEQVANAFEQTRDTPMSFLIDRQGRIVKRFVGAPQPEALQAAIEEALART
jgi:peroxiredoxin